MANDLDKLMEHELNDDCPVCRAQELVDVALLPAAQAWEERNELPRHGLMLHGAAGLLAVLLEDGVPRDDIEGAVARLLDEIEQAIAENRAMGGPPQGTA